MSRIWGVAACVLMALAAGPAAAGHTAGDRVLGRWIDGMWYPAKVQGVREGRVALAFDDGGRLEVPADGARGLDWKAGARVECRWKDKARYFPGKLVRVAGDRVSIAYDDGDKEDAAIGICRQRDAKTPKTVEGKRILAQWVDGLWYPGRARPGKKGTFHVFFDDGDAKIVDAAQVRELAWKVGDAIQCKWKLGRVYYPGKVTARDAEKVDVLYDDGERESTRVSVCRSK